MRFYKVIFYSVCFLFMAPLSIGQKDITLEDLWKRYTYYDNQIPGFNFQKDGQHYTRLQNNKILSYDITTGKLVKTIFDGTKFKGLQSFNGSVSGFSFSDDEEIILVKSESEAIYRHSTKAQFYIYNRSENTLSKLFNGEKQMYADR